jgi:hypothetical protein
MRSMSGGGAPSMSGGGASGGRAMRSFSK